MATPNPFPLPIQQKVNNPHIQALLEQYGHDKYVNAEDVNKIIQALNFLHVNINGDGNSVYLTYSEYLQDVLVRLEDKQDILTDIIFGNFINGLNVKNTLIDNDQVISRNSVTGKSVKTSWLNVWVSNLRTKVINEIASALFAFKVAEVDTKIPLSQKAAVNGVATLGPDTKVPAAQLKFGDVAGTITEGNDSRLVEAFRKKINAISITGDSNKTITLTREDGTTLTATFLDNDTEYPDDVINTLTFNANNDGVLIAITSEGEVLSVSIDGRYSLLGHTHSINEITGLEDALNGKENTFSKNTAFNKNFGTTAGTVVEGNDPRLIGTFINVKTFGAVGDGITDDTIAIQNALNSIPAQGGTLYFPAGKYRVTQKILVNKKVKFLGDGCSNFDWVLEGSTIIDAVINDKGSVIITSNGTIDLIEETVGGVDYDSIGFVNDSVSEPTAGSAINKKYAGSFHMRAVHIRGFYDGIGVHLGTRWSISDTNIWYPRNRGMFIESSYNSGTSDTGDWSISGSNIITNKNGVTGIDYRSGGGGKIVNTKINPSNNTRFGIGINLYAEGSSSILLVANCSIEGFENRAIKIGTDGVHSWDSINIHGNQMESHSDESYTNGVTMIEVQGSGETIRNISINGNTIKRSGAITEVPAVIVNGVSQLNTSGNQIVGFKNKWQITNTPSLFQLDAEGMTFKGQVGISNPIPFKGYRGFANQGISLLEDLSGVLVETDLNVDISGVAINLMITGFTYVITAPKPIESNLQLLSTGSGTIVSCSVLNKGGGIDDAKAFYLNDKLCFWIKPKHIYSNFNFEIQTGGQVINIVNSTVSALPSDRVGEVTATNYNAVTSLDTDWIDITATLPATLPASYSDIVLRYKIKNNTYILDFSATCDGSGTASTANHVIYASLPKVDSEKARFINLENFKEEISGGSNGMFDIRLKSDGNYGTAVSLICGLKDNQTGTSRFRAVLPIVDFN